MSIKQIFRWEAVLDGCKNSPKPAIYVEPDLQFLDYISRNNNRVRVKISGTNDNKYDNVVFWGTVDKSSIVPNCRPNFFNATELYVIILDGVWNGYPLQNGQITFVDSVVGQLKPLNLNKNSGLSQYMSMNNDVNEKRGEGLSRVQILGILAIILIILGSITCSKIF